MMIGHIVFNNREHGRAIADRAGTTYDSTKDVVLSHVSGRGFLTGGILYSQVTDASCAMHVAAFRKPWGSRDLVWVAFDYPFRQLSLERVFGYLDERNEEALKFDLHMGFRIVDRIKGVYAGGVARLVLAMEFDECRWLHLKPRSFRIGV